MWLRDENCAEIVSEVWERGGDLCSKIASTSSRLSAWSREKFGDFVKEFQACRSAGETYKGRSIGGSEVIAQMWEIDNRIDELERREEIYWKQRSRHEWLKHASIVINVLPQAAAPIWASIRSSPHALHSCLGSCLGFVLLHFPLKVLPPHARNLLSGLRSSPHARTQFFSSASLHALLKQLRPSCGVVCCVAVCISLPSSVAVILISCSDAVLLCARFELLFSWVCSAVGLEVVPLKLSAQLVLSSCFLQGPAGACSTLEHKICVSARRKRKWNSAQDHSKDFVDWFRDKVDLILKEGQDIIPNHILWLSKGPSHIAKKYTGYSVNGYRFHTMKRDANCVTQNSGATLTAMTHSFASSKDQNPIEGNVNYYGSIIEIIEISYHGYFCVVLFKCVWFHSEMDDDELVMINMCKTISKEEPFILASQAHQVFYVENLNRDGWQYAIQILPRELSDDLLSPSARQTEDDSTSEYDAEEEGKTMEDDSLVSGKRKVYHRSIVGQLYDVQYLALALNFWKLLIMVSKKPHLIRTRKMAIVEMNSQKRQHVDDFCNNNSVDLAKQVQDHGIQRKQQQQQVG
uniref:DUF4216 domain-containing protein n=1 Tax=Chenopodium quinoa TaxID=63459 RepID=A0A803LYX4_CHEQI